jgi:RNA polymerase sigma factor (TIGR02999 family)
MATGTAGRFHERSHRGGTPAADVLLPQVYDELRKLAQRHLQREGGPNTLQATALVHEAYLKLVEQSRAQYNDQVHFFAVAAQAIRRILVDHARTRGRKKRGGGHRLVLTDSVPDAPHHEVDLIALDQALKLLAACSQRQALVVEMRYFAGLTIEQVAQVLDVSARTVEGVWTMARAWLKRELDDGQTSRGSPAT